MKYSIFLMMLLFIIQYSYAQPLNDITERTIVREKKVLSYPPIREGDILWEKRVWRILDVREKMNLPFAYPNAPLFQIMVDAALNNDIPLYSVESDDFSEELTKIEIKNTIYTSDTIVVIDPKTYIETLTVVENQINVEDIKRFRIKEVWYVDSHTSTMKVRILGIAPMIDVKDENDNLRYEKPLFWMHYPSSRDHLARHTVFNTGNDSSRMTWEDLFEMRQFDSYVYKASNVHDLRFQDHYAGRDLLLNAQKAEQSIFNYEQDLWSR